MRPKRECLFRDWQGLCFVCYAALSMAAAASSGPGWLPTVGPTPLRFAPALRPRPNRLALPVVATVPEPAPVVSQAPKPPPAPVVLAPLVMSPRSDTKPAPPPVESGQPDPVVSPQMLLKYFTNPANNAAPAPPDAAPPRAAEAPPSRATYETSP
jgi:hypothetical protein